MIRMQRKRHLLRLALLVTVTFSAGACSLLYQPDIQQGNIITARSLRRLRIGMTKDQVRYLLGAAPLKDAFFHDRWDYYYSYERDGGRRVQQTLTLHFAKGRLVSMSGTLAPTPASPAG
ncbi:MAG: outer membrane protein assembly factor BamE [Acidiferrobacteraceae bacterium]